MVNIATSKLEIKHFDNEVKFQKIKCKCKPAKHKYLRIFLNF